MKILPNFAHEFYSTFNLSNFGEDVVLKNKIILDFGYMYIAYVSCSVVYDESSYVY